MILYQDRFMERDELHIDVEDRGYQFGDGVYEVIRIYNGVPFLMTEHLERLERSAKAIKMSLPYSLHELDLKLKELVSNNQLIDGIIYLQITRGVAPRIHQFPQGIEPVLTAYVRELPRPLAQMANGGKAILVEDIRWLRCDIKSLNLLPNVLAKQEAVEAKAIEAIQHRNGTITEGSASNVFIVKKGTIYTHPANHYILNGITRQFVFQLAGELGLPIAEKAYTKEELLTADEIFFTSTTAEVSPIVTVDDQIIGNGKPGPVTIQLQKIYDRYVADLSLEKH
ncbi:D-amino-acid transaminase [Microaerobacter geothermalis]|uniref:D-amino-acid transaminase n=1 Tax=Microaerobacter geothermalis TaxID=674972 RepID=UPI001F30557A|nr:D-amino-acid transaminase [Microaerobacter geothermalis]MCF6094182.1 D-amino-acid transaminase [Microaerobacter geothermalis]